MIGRRLAGAAWVVWAACAAWVMCGAACREAAPRPAAAEPARAVEVARGDVVDRAVLTGELRAASSLGMTVPRTDAWQLAVRWMADDGALVKAGDKVLEFDNSVFTEQLAQRRLALLDAEMTLRGAQDLSAIETATRTTELRQHQIALDKTRLRADVAPELLPGRDVQERQLAHKRAEVAVRKAEQTLAAQRAEAALELRVKQIELDKAKRAIETAERTIAELVMTAPRDGLIFVEDHPWLGRKLRIGDTVQPGMTVVSLPDMTRPMEVHAELSDVDDGRVALGMTGTCTLDAYPGDPIACTVKDLTPVARSKAGGSLRRAFAVVLELRSSEDQDGEASAKRALGKTDAARMRPGMSVKVELRPRAQAGAVMVPRAAIVMAEPGAAKASPRVRLAGGELREVTLGPCSAQACAVLTGVAGGDRVLIGDSP